MGAGASAQSGIFEPPDGTLDPEAEWRSENVRELDRLGGNQRPPIKRGESTKYRLEWLKEALHEQSDRLEEALAKDPLAGRHEIMRQEAVKLARNMNANNHRFTVREWQTMKHTDLRALQARDELERRLRERDKANGADGDGTAERPAWNSLHWSPNEHRRSIAKTQPSQLTSVSSTSPPRSSKQGAAGVMNEAAEDVAVVEPRSSSPSLGFMLPLGSSPVPAGLLGSLTRGQTESGEDVETIPRVFRPLATNRTADPPAEWRLRILRAKRKAMMIISVVLAFRGRKHRSRGLQRLDSLSYFIAHHLGADLPRFSEEQSTFRVTRAAAADLQALAEEVWRECNYQQQQHEQPAFPYSDLDGTLVAGGVTESGESIPTVALPVSPGGHAGGWASGGFKAPAPPQLRLPPGLSSGGSLSGGGTCSARGGSPLLRSRPINLTPTMHHHGPSGAGASSGSVQAQGPSSAGVTGSHRSLHSGPHPPVSSATCSGAGGSVSGGGGGSAAGGATLSGPLPVLRGHNSGRLQVPLGLGAQLGLESENSSNMGVACGVGKGARFSAPGCEPLPADDPSSVSICDALPAAPTVVMAAVPTQAPSSPGGSKRWMSPRFARRANDNSGVDGGESTSRSSQGHNTASGAAAAASKRVATVVAEDTSVVARAQSWAGPSPLQVHTGGAGSSGGHPRSIGHDNMPVSPSGTGPGGIGTGVLPAPPPLPSPVSRNPRKRRESISVLTGGPTAGFPPHPHITRSQTTTGDGYTFSAASAAVAAVPERHTPAHNSRRGGSVTRSGSAVSSVSAGSSRNTACARRRPNRIGGSATGEPGSSALRSISPYTERLGLGAQRALRSSSTIRRMVRDGSSDQLYLRYREEAASLERPLRMMHLFANRANARWVEELAGAPPPVSASTSSGSLTCLNGGGGGAGGSAALSALGTGWEAPHVYDGTRFSTSVGSAQASVFRAEVATMLRAGRMAVQLLAGDESIVMADGQRQSLWNADPWDLIATSFPAKVAAADRVCSVHMGPRLLMALVTAVETLAGPEAVAKLVVVLHVNDTQQTDVVRELRFRRFCGLRPENLVLLVQNRRPGYYWDPEQTIFVPDESSPPGSLGTGYAIMQLVWAEEGLKIPPEELKVATTTEAPTWASASGAAAASAAAAAAAAAAQPLPLVSLGTSVLEYLSRRGVEWLLTRRLRDIGLYNPDLTLNSEILSYMLYLHEHLGANMAVQVEMADSLTAARAAQTGIILAPPRLQRVNGITGSGATTSPPSTRAGTSPSPRRAGTLPAGSGSGGGGGGGRRASGGGRGGTAGSRVPTRVGSDVASASQPENGGVGGSLHPHLVVDVKNSDTLTPRVIQMLTDLRMRSKGKLAVSTRRYLWRIDLLQKLVQRASIFHPCLDVSGDLVYLSFDMADLTSATDCGARCVAVSGGPRPVRSLNAVTDLEELLGSILAQDAHAPFRRLAANISPAYGPPNGIMQHERGAARTGLHPAVTGSTPTSSVTGGIDGAVTALANLAVAPLADMRNLPAGQRIVVLIADNESTTMAVQLLMAMVKPGRDHVAMVTVVPSVLQEASGRMLLRKHEMAMKRTMVEVTTELLTKGSNGSLIDQLESYIEEADAHLIVMGSQALATAQSSGASHGHSPLLSSSASSGGASGGIFSTGGASPMYGSGASLSSSGGAAVLGSVAVSLLRNTTRPVLIVKANAKFASVAWDKDKLRVLLEVHHSSRNLLRYVCSKLVSPPRHDKVFLVRGGAKDPSQQETVTSRRLLENFSDIATQYKVGVVKRALEEPFETGAIKWAEHDKAHIIAVHAAAGRGISNANTHILRAARSAVLVYKSTEHQ